jgi:hypothetical protein
MREVGMYLRKAWIFALAILVILPSQSFAADGGTTTFSYTFGTSSTTNFGNAGLGDFYITDGSISYSGTGAWSDAYDNGGLVDICSSASCTAGGTGYANYSGVGTSNATTGIYQGASQSINGLNVTASFKFSKTSGAARLLVQLDNNSASPVNRMIQIRTGLGCDSGCYLEFQSSTGNTQSDYFAPANVSYTTSSYWTITTDKGISDPITSFALGTSGATVSPSTTITNSGGDNFFNLFNVTVPANSTKYLMIIMGLGGIIPTTNTYASAYNGVSTYFTSYSNLPADLKSDITGSIPANILNWAIGPFTSTTSIALAANATTASKRTPVQITATVNRPGRVTFYYNNQKIAGCINIVAASTTATCNWKPILHGQQNVFATLVPDDSSYSGSSASVVVTIGKRTTSR